VVTAPFVGFAAPAAAHTTSATKTENAPSTVRRTASKAPHHTVGASAAKKRAIAVATMTAAVKEKQHVSSNCKQSILSLLKLKIAENMKLMKAEMAMIRMMELSIQPASSPNSNSSSYDSDGAYKEMGDGMGVINHREKLLPTAAAPMTLQEDEDMVKSLMDLSNQHIQLCRNFEDRFNEELFREAPVATSASAFDTDDNTEVVIRSAGVMARTPP
jgi:hypothetical protein